MKTKTFAFLMIFLLATGLQSCIWVVPKDISDNGPADQTQQAENNATRNAYQKIKVAVEDTETTPNQIYFPPEACFFATAEVIEVCPNKE